jgi:methionyl aminopeptidase
MIHVKSDRELLIMRRAGQVLARVMKKLVRSVRAGMTTLEVDALAEYLIAEAGEEPAFKGYRGYPATACVSVNDEIVHGIPGDRMIYEGDIVSIDLGLRHEGFYSDMALTVGVGRVAPDRVKLLRVAREALRIGINKAREGNHLSDISYAIQAHAEQNGFSVVRQFVGHGIGANLHEEPEVPNFGRPHQGVTLTRGMVLAIEPMINAGTPDARIASNGWTASTADGKPSAHFEHTVAITARGPLILTV